MLRSGCDALALLGGPWRVRPPYKLALACFLLTTRRLLDSERRETAQGIALSWLEGLRGSGRVSAVPNSLGYVGPAYLSHTVRSLLLVCRTDAPGLDLASDLWEG